VEDLTRLSAESSTVVEDAVLDRLGAASDAEDSLFDTMGAAPTSAPGAAEDQPIDLELRKPMAVDLEELCQLAQKPIPPVAAAALGPNRGLLLCHAMTAFAPPGERPSSIWGMGYEVILPDVGDASTISLAPDSKFESVARASAQVSLGLSAGGKIGIPIGAVTGLPIPLTIPGINLEASTDDSFSVILKCDMRFVTVQAGPVGAGGARWNLYRHGQDLRSAQLLFQTVLVPRDVDELVVKLETWVRKRGFFGGRWGAQEYRYPTETYTLSLT
jgi:hypothetical protein